MQLFSRVSLQPCEAPAWAQGGHAQTILGHLIPSRTEVPRESLRGTLVEIPLPDGDRLVAKHISSWHSTSPHRVGSRAAPSGGSVLYLFHGIASNISADYMVRTAALGHRLGWDVYLVNHRGCGEGRGLARKPYHSGRGEDLSEVIRFGRSRHPGKKHLAIGFSLSANALLLLLTGRRGEVKPDAAIAVNGPIDLANAAKLLERGLNRVYDLRFSAECRIDVKYRQWKGLLDRKYSFPWFSTLREFDSIYTCAAGGFTNREDYYSSCSTQAHLASIQVPTVLLTSEDDPFIDYRDYAGAKLSPHVLLHIEKTGGHLGYLHARKTPFGSNRWLDYALWEYMSCLERA